MTDILDTVAVDYRETARSALTTAFGATACAGQPITGGASGALTYRVEAGGRAYLLRIETRRDVFRNPQQYACMQIASEAGIAPPIRHVDDAAGVAIMDFLPERPLTDYPGGPAAVARDVGGLIARLQATPTFPPLRDYLVILERLLGYVRGSRVFAPGLLDPHAAGFARIREAYPWDASSLVSSHNDPNPRNIIFDGERLWLVDWETAYRNDPLVDVAILIDNLAPTATLEDALLAAWLGRALHPTKDRALRGRLVLMRQLTRLYYAGLIFSGFAAAPAWIAPDADLAAPSPAEFRAAYAEGRLVAGAPDTLYTLGKMFLAGFLAGLTAPGFEEALVAAREG